MSTVYQQDIKTARNMLDAYSPQEVINLFRLTPAQAKYIENVEKPINRFKDINENSKTRPRVMTPAMVEVAANLYMFQNCPMYEIAKLYSVDNSTVSRALKSYHGFEK